MIIGSHNSWSFLNPKYLFLRPFNFIAKCQKFDIRTQYEKYNVRCFDLRISFNIFGDLQICHGLMIYDYKYGDLLRDLDFLNKNKATVRLILDARTKIKYERCYSYFRKLCSELTYYYSNITFWCGRNLYNWNIDYNFKEDNITCKEDYASVSNKKWINQFFPLLYAKRNNKRILSKEYKEDILLIDFVNIK